MVHLARQIIIESFVGVHPLVNPPRNVHFDRNAVRPRKLCHPLPQPIRLLKLYAFLHLMPVPISPSSFLWYGILNNATRRILVYGKFEIF